MMRVTVKYKNGIKECLEDVERVEEVPIFGKPAVMIKCGDTISVIEKEDINKIKIEVGERDA